MKHHLSAVVVLAAMVAVPALAAAKSANDVSPSAGVLAQTSSTTVVPRNGDPSEAMADAEDIYLTSLCPTVMAHPGNHSALLNRFCRHG